MDERKEKLKMIVNLYLELYVKVSMNENYVLNYSASQETMIYNFIDYFGAMKITKDFLRAYFEFQFNYTYKFEKFGKGKVMLNWVIGKKAIERWKDRDKFKFKYHILYGIKKHINISNKNPASIGWLDKLAKGLPHEDDQRAKHLNTNKGVLWCYSNTTMYNHRSDYCVMCKFSDICKLTLAEENPKLYKLRGYE